MSIHQHEKRKFYINKNNINPQLDSVHYPIRGRVPMRANEIEKEMNNGVKKPFDRLIRANIGDCHANGQQPITFYRQLMAVCSYPELMNNKDIPQDVKERAKLLLASCPGGSIGSYTETAGLEIVLKDAANFIRTRDGVECDPDSIFISSITFTVKTFIQLLTNGPYNKPAGFLIPIPQYPIYEATVNEFSAKMIGYYLNEDDNWGLDMKEIERAYQESLSWCEPKAIVIINPGNPTGQVLSLENVQDIIKWAYDKKLLIIADEVYQDNVYEENLKFHSFKKVAHDLGYPYNQIEMVIFFSASKGYMGECGMRIGYFEMVNIDPEVSGIMLRVRASYACSNVLGQICLDAVVNPPKPGDPSYELFNKEKNQILSSLKERAKLVTELLNKIEGVHCNPVQGALYAFPRVMIPQRAVDHALKHDMEPDMFYCLELLDKGGICVVPGSGFKQLPGTYHFRMTILPPIEELKIFIKRFEEFHVNFLKEWS